MSANSGARRALWVLAAGAALVVAADLAGDRDIYAQAGSCGNSAATLTKIQTNPPGSVAAPGQEVTYQIDLELLTIPGQNGAMNDTPDPVSSFVVFSAVPSGWSCGGSSCTNSGNFSGLQRFGVVIRMPDTPPSPVPSVVNNVTASFTQVGAGTVNCSASATTRMLGVPALSLAALVMMLVLLLAAGTWLTSRKQRTPAG